MLFERSTELNQRFTFMGLEIETGECRGRL